MKRYAYWLALVSMSLSPVVSPALAATKSADAKKFCSEQWDAEQKSKTIPRGMTHEKYMRQCTKNYAANHAEQTPPPSTDPQQPPANSAATWPPAPSGSN